jgi:uncharacterized OsmC-like protein
MFHNTFKRSSWIVKSIQLVLVLSLLALPGLAQVAWASSSGDDAYDPAAGGRPGLSLVPPSGQPVTIEEAQPEPSPLATASAVSRLSNQPGRAIVTARGNHFVVDSVPPLGGPNEERNPLDLMLGALATCGTFIYEAAAAEMGIPLTEIAAMVEGDFDPVGLKDGSVNPRIQALRVHMDLAGPNEAQAEALAAHFRARCPIYTTLSRSAPIEIQNVTE